MNKYKRVFVICWSSFVIAVYSHASSPDLITAYDVAKHDRRIKLKSSAVDLYASGKQYVRVDEKVCIASDAAYLDGLRMPREQDIFPMYGAGTSIVKRTPSKAFLHIEWHEDGAFHGDYASLARDGWYDVNAEGRIIRAGVKNPYLRDEYSVQTLTYSFQLPPEPSSAPSCYTLQLGH